MLHLILFIGVFFGASKEPQRKTITHGKIRIDLNIDLGGRIDQICYNEQPLLFPAKEHPEYNGSVWWPSPQKDWHWPPPKSIDRNPYKLTRGNGLIQLRSIPGPESDLQLKKTIQLLNDHQIRLIYEATNIGKLPKKFGHWEVTRLPKGGRVIFPVGELLAKKEHPKLRSSLFFNDPDLIPSCINKNEKCFNIEISEKTACIPQTDKFKLLADASEGWAAYLKDGLLLVKRFKDTPIAELPPEQGEVELFVNPSLNFIELEQHGQYQKVLPDHTSIWVVDWYILEYPSALSQDVKIIKEFINNNIHLISSY